MGRDIFRSGVLLAVVAAASACGGKAIPPADNQAGAHTIDFTGQGVHVFAAEWLVVQPNVSGSVDSQTEVAYAPANWSTHPRALEAQSLSLCGSSLNEDESIRNLDSAGVPQPAAEANIRSVRVSEATSYQVPFCTSVHHVGQTWSFQHDPVVPTVDTALGQASGDSPMLEDHVDLVAVLFERDVFVTAMSYETSP
jgi:hypothetical protein